MKILPWITLTGTTMSLLRLAPAPAETLSNRDRLQSVRDSTAVVAAVERFRQSIASGDSAAALAVLAPNAVILESGGIESLAEYRASHLASDIVYARAMKSDHRLAGVTVRGDVAWVSSTSTTSGEDRGRSVNSAGAELMVLTRTVDGWRIAAVHWSSRARRQ